MPITNINSSLEKGPGGGGRTTFRPPWVKETNTPTTPWSKRNSTAGATAAETSKENGQPTGAEKKEVKLQSKEIKVPVTTITATKKPSINAATTAKPKEAIAAAAKKDDEKKSTNRTIPIEVKTDTEKAKTGSGGEKPGKFVRPVLKKVAKIESAPVAPVVLEKTQLKETPKVVSAPASAKKTPPAVVSKIATKPAAKHESDEEEEETSSEEEETEEEEEETDEEEEETEEEESEDEPSTTVSSTSKSKYIYLFIDIFNLSVVNLFSQPLNYNFD